MFVSLTFFFHFRCILCGFCFFVCLVQRFFFVIPIACAIYVTFFNFLACAFFAFVGYFFGNQDQCFSQVFLIKTFYITIFEIRNDELKRKMFSDSLCKFENYGSISCMGVQCSIIPWNITNKEVLFSFLGKFFFQFCKRNITRHFILFFVSFCCDLSETL